ncbi:hypothetical protein GH714_006626 [Hevea brasiliensis]|uniref:Uncharacterized protein n=1 Tax=Hevea brasiliensis TaxID=3981 RepID=A0A6A6N2N5_HEVBR|nr:hypothetical protein GH714_006626 [Hevea brasiliensis]
MPKKVVTDNIPKRINSGMEDSTTMTIEFLRARLLSERSVSRTARQRADELAKRVAELQERLTIVSLQRMKAEKATAGVLAILDGNGISHISETFDSSSEQDTPCECKVVTARSLSWKGRKDSPRYLEKYKGPSPRRRTIFASVGSSPKHRPGKSCCQIRRRESRSVAEELKANPVKVDALEDEVATTPDNFPNCPDVEPGMLEGIVKCGEEKTLLKHSLSSCLGNGQNTTSSDGVDYNVYGETETWKRHLNTRQNSLTNMKQWKSSKSGKRNSEKIITVHRYG